RLDRQTVLGAVEKISLAVLVVRIPRKYIEAWGVGALCCGAKACHCHRIKRCVRSRIHWEHWGGRCSFGGFAAKQISAYLFNSSSISSPAFRATQSAGADPGKLGKGEEGNWRVGKLGNKGGSDNHLLLGK